MTLQPPLPNRILKWADRLLYIGLVLAVLTWAIDGLGMLTLFLIPCCFWLSWVGYVASGPPLSSSASHWLRAGLGALAGHAVLFWMCRNGYLKSSLICGTELLLALGWLACRRGWRSVAATAIVALGGWAAIAWLGLKSGSLFEAVRNNDRPWTKALLWSGADPNQKTRSPELFAGIPVLYEALQ